MWNALIREGRQYFVDCRIVWNQADYGVKKVILGGSFSNIGDSYGSVNRLSFAPRNLAKIYVNPRSLLSSGIANRGIQCGPTLPITCIERSFGIVGNLLLLDNHILSGLSYLVGGIRHIFHSFSLSLCRYSQVMGITAPFNYLRIGGFMDLLAAIKREERKLEKELGQLQNKLNGVRAAAKALGSKASREVTQVKKRVMSAAARAKIGKATKARWAKFRAAKNKKAKVA
jgi:hypothetical protein